MKNKLKNLLTLFVVSLLMPLALSAQTVVTRTTLSSAMAAGARQMVVASATGFSTQTNTQQNYVLIEQDLRQVLTVSGTTVTLSPARGPAVGHVSGATVVFGTPGNWLTGTAGTTSGATGVFVASAPPSGACLRANQQYTPVFITSPTLNATADCLGGKWVVGTFPDVPGNPYLVGPCTVPIGSVAYGSFGTSTTPSTTGQLNASIFVPQTLWATGITNLNGSAVDGASKKVVILHDTSGNVITNSATAGTTATGNDAFQAIAFTAARFVIGPAYYVVGLQDDTADTNGVRTVAAATFNNLIAGSTTSVFGTVAAITVPTTFTGDTGPIACIY